MSSVDTAAEPGPYPRSTSARGETARRALDEAARRAATATGRAATEAEKARAEDIVDVGATGDGGGAVARACESAREAEGATFESISDAPCLRTGG